MPTGGNFSCPSGTGPVVDNELRVLCDAGGAVFLRRYVITDGTAATVDTELDGITPVIAAEPVGLCAQGPAEESPGELCETTTPTATLGLCLADGTPIAVVVTRGCDGTVTQDGWINLTSGAWSAGTPPAGTVACGSSRSIEVSGVFCDMLPDGTVAGLVLIEYQYAADGTIAGVRLVDATTGDTYIPQGEVTTCPAGVEQPERDLLALCDVTDDESGMVLSEPFVRDYQRDQNGAITGHTDYTLDGQPYTPVGTVGVCQEQPDEPCPSTVTVLHLCDLDPDVEPNDEGKRCAVPFLRHLVYDCTGALTETRDTTPDGSTPYTPVEAVDCGTGGTPALVEVPWEVVSIEQDPDSDEGRGLVFTLSPTDDPSTVGTVTVTTSSIYNPSSCPGVPPNYQYRNPTTYTFTPDQVLRDAATYVRVDLEDFDTFEPVTGLTPAPDRLGGTAYWDGTTVRPTENNGTGEMYYDGPPEAWSYRVGNTGGGNSCSSLSFAAVSLRAEGCCAPCGQTEGGGDGRTVQPVCVIATAAPEDVQRWTRVIDADGTAYYLDPSGARYDDALPAGYEITACPEEEPQPCRDTSTLLLCDAASGTETVTPTVTSTTLDGLDLGANPAYPLLEGSWAALWAGGALTFPQDPDASAGDGRFQVYRTIAGQITGTVPEECATASGTLTVSVRVTNDGPNPGAGGSGLLRLYRDGVALASAGPVVDTPVGHVQTLTVTAPVTPADLASGALVVLMSLETFHTTPKSWTADQFMIAGDMAGCQVQFLRTVTTDCETGEVVAVTDTTLDGTPYTVTGDVGQCTTVTPPEAEECTHCETLTLCDAAPDESPGAPDVAYETVPLAELGPAPATGVLPNGVGYSVNVGAWGAAQGHYTFYPPEGTQLWTFDQPVYVRFGLRGLNVSPPECLRVPEGAVAESISPVHTWDEDSRLLCGIVGESDAADESVFYFPEPVTELPLVAVQSDTGGRGPGLIQAGFAVDAPAPGTSVPFGRTVCRDCSGTVTSITDTTLDGQPYTVTGEVGQCQPVVECCEQPLPEERVDVESDVMCIRDAAGEIVQQVVVERVYDDQTGERTLQRLTEPTTGAPVELPAGATLVLCTEPECPVAFSTECVGVVERTEASYDNTSLIGGLPGLCGSVQGPDGQFPCTAPDDTPFTIVSWIVNGEEVMGEGGGRQFNGGACGPGTDDALGMHRSWAEALTNLDPTGATWEVKSADSCAWFVGSAGGTDTVYGPMTVVGTSYGGVPESRWVLGPAQSCTETPYTKVYTQDCDGTVSVSWLTEQGVPTDAPTGDLVPCGTGCGKGGGEGLDVEVLTVCDVNDDESGAVAAVPFLRHLVYDTGGAVAYVVDTGLDGLTPYTPSGTVGVCPAGGDQPVTVLEQCRCDDTDGDGVADTSYVELVGVAADGTLTSLGTHTPDLSAPYEPVAPVECATDGAPAPVATVQAHRVEVPAGGSWTADGVPLLHAVTLTAWGAGAQITTEDGTSTLHDGESASWSISRDGDAFLTGPLSVTATAGTVTVTYTTGGTA